MGLSLEDKMKEIAIRELDEELPDKSIVSLAKYLEEHSKIGPSGRCSSHTLMNKEALRLASVYLFKLLEVVYHEEV